MRRVLIQEPSEGLREDLVAALRSAGYEAHALSDLSSAVERASSIPFEAALIDLRDERDLESLAKLRAVAPRLAVVATGNHPSVDLAVSAMKQGARDFLRKPFGVARLEATLASALGAGEGAPNESVSGIVTEDPGMERLLRQLDAAAPTEATVQIVGESGTGKDVLARHLHLRSARRSAPFVVVNCAALPESLAESELFGHERGAFTGAVEARSGQILRAHQGTLMLDEIGELSHALQPKLLRVLQEREVLPVGALRYQAVDVRIVTTTQRELGQEVEAGRFREDLYFRLDVIVLHVPPLRERPGDIPLLAHHFLARFAESGQVDVPRLSPSAVSALSRHPFRGNVRELENLMRRAVVLFPGREVDMDRLLAGKGGEATGPRITASTLNLKELERRAIVQSLAECGGNRTLASEKLGISVRTLRNKIRLYQLA